VQPPEIPAFVCSHVFGASKPILMVSREDGDWQFLCGGQHPALETPRVVGLNHLLERDETLAGVLDLPENYTAERKSPLEDWVRVAIPVESRS
jgi:hypothetical protein